MLPRLRLLVTIYNNNNNSPGRYALEKLKNLAEHLFLFPFFGGVTTIAGVVAGYLGSHFDKEVVAALHPWFWSGYVFSPEASYVWAAAWVFGACFTGTLWAQARSSQRATDSLHDATRLVAKKTDSLNAKTDALDGLVRQLHTLPPKGFLVKYRDAIHYANEAFFDVQACEATDDEMETAIRTQLICVLTLASAFDVDGDKAKYGCNVMAFRDAGSLSDEDADAIDKRMKFVDSGVTVRKLDGALDLLLPLSVSSSSGVRRDPTLTAFALPIPAVSNHELGGLLPGAPLAFVTEPRPSLRARRTGLAVAARFLPRFKRS